MHILFLSDNFPPEVNAPASRTFEHCREWARAGHQVTVITCAPNFPRGVVYEGYRNSLWRQETLDGVRVVRVWSYITANEGFARRVLDYMSYMVAGFVASFFVRDVDLVIGTSPQFFTVCAAYVTSRFKRIPFVLELRDLWPESITAVGAMRDSIALRWLERLELFLYRKADLIVSVTGSFKQILTKRGVDSEKIKVVTNGVDLSRFRPQPKDSALVRELGLEGKFVAGYVGTHGMAHGLDTLLNAASLLWHGDQEDRFRFVFLGDGSEKRALVEMARTKGLGNVIFLESVTKKEVIRYWSILDVSIIHLKKTKLFEAVIPSKLFESMGMGIPVLLGVRGESASIVEKEDVGMVFEPGNADQLVQELLAISENTNLYHRLHNASLQTVGNYDRRILARKMLVNLEGLMANQSGMKE